MLDRAILIIPCLNEEQHLPKLVEGLLRDIDPRITRIVIADGGSTDRTADIAKTLEQKNPLITYLHNPKKRQSAAVNLAVATYGDDADFLIRIDAHADYPPDYGKNLLDEALLTKADSVVVAMQTTGLAGFQKAVAAAQNSALGNGGSAHRRAGGAGQWVDHGHHALMRIDAFRKVGGYDESFAHNEDAELDHRLTRAGCRIWLTAKTVMTYYPRATPVALFHQYRGYGAGRARTILKHQMRPKLRQLIPVGVFPAVVLALFTPWFALAGVPFLLWLSLCLGYGLMLAYRAKDTTLAASGIAASIMHAAWSLGFWQTLVKAAGRHHG